MSYIFKLLYLFNSYNSYIFLEYLYLVQTGLDPPTNYVHYHRVKRVKFLNIRLSRILSNFCLIMRSTCSCIHVFIS